VNKKGVPVRRPKRPNRIPFAIVHGSQPVQSLFPILGNIRSIRRKAAKGSTRFFLRRNIFLLTNFQPLFQNLMHECQDTFQLYSVTKPSFLPAKMVRAYFFRSAGSSKYLCPRILIETRFL